MKSKTCLCVLAVSKLFCLGKVLVWFGFFPSFSFFYFFLRVGKVFSLMIHSMKASSSVEANALLHSPFC